MKMIQIKRKTQKFAGNCENWCLQDSVSLEESSNNPKDLATTKNKCSYGTPFEYSFDRIEYQKTSHHEQLLVRLKERSVVTATTCDVMTLETT